MTTKEIKKELEKLTKYADEVKMSIDTEEHEDCHDVTLNVWIDEEYYDFSLLYGGTEEEAQKIIKSAKRTFKIKD